MQPAPSNQPPAPTSSHSFGISCGGGGGGAPAPTRASGAIRSAALAARTVSAPSRGEAGCSTSDRARPPCPPSPVGSAPSTRTPPAMPPRLPNSGAVVLAVRECSCGGGRRRGAWYGWRGCGGGCGGGRQGHPIRGSGWRRLAGTGGTQQPPECPPPLPHRGTPASPSVPAAGGPRGASGRTAASGRGPRGGPRALGAARRRRCGRAAGAPRRRGGAGPVPPPGPCRSRCCASSGRPAARRVTGGLSSCGAPAAAGAPSPLLAQLPAAHLGAPGRC